MATTIDATDIRYMQMALGLARRGLGTVWPNPAVGCVLVDAEGRVAGRGWTQPGGRPHAEAEALARAGAGARGATAYVSLEPCSHTGETPPCADRLIEAGIVRAVIAISDPDERVSGSGIARLERAGMEVLTGVGTAAATELNAGYLRRVEDGRPLVTLKVATTLDGRIATHAGESRWITGDIARGWAHFLRASHDAVMVGLGTAIADDPRLTCRLPGLEDRSPVRVVVDGRLRLPLTSQLVSGARQTPSWIVTLAGGEARRRDAFIESGVEMIEVEAGADDNPDMGLALDALGDRGLTRVLVEGGSKLAASLLKARLVDRLAWFRSPDIMGGDGVPVAEAFGVDALTDMLTFTRLSMVEAGDDVLETYTFSG